MKIENILLKLSLIVSVLAISACTTTQNSTSTQQTNNESEAQSVAVSEAPKVKYEDKELKKIANYKIDPKISNPAPAKSLNQFGNFVLKQVVLSSENKESDGAKRAQEVMESELESGIVPLLESWKKEGSTLLIQPEITSLRMISGTARFWAGAFAGGSHVTLKLTLIDESTGEEVAAPTFFRKSNAYGAAWSGGAADRDIYRRAVKLAEFYFLENYNEVVPAPSGRE